MNVEPMTSKGEIDDLAAVSVDEIKLNKISNLLAYLTNPVKENPLILIKMPNFLILFGSVQLSR